MVVELIVVSLVVATGFSALITSGVQVFINRQNREIEKRISNAIPASIREEIEQTPGWWDKQFHKLLMYSPGVKINVSSTRTEYWAGRSREFTDTWLEGCVCTSCQIRSQRSAESTKSLDNDTKFGLDSLHSILERERKMREPEKTRDGRIGPLAKSVYEQYRRGERQFASHPGGPVFSEEYLRVMRQATPSRYIHLDNHDQLG